MTREVEVAQVVEVEVDEKKFTPDFMAEFRRDFYPFLSIEDHLRHLAQLHARNIAGNDSFIEGYGPAKEMGIRFESHSFETMII